jgi:hypothetical protein
MAREYVSLPRDISNEMRLWRMGFGAMPKSYIGFHERLAEKELESLQKVGVVVMSISKSMKSDGWFDGMRVVHAAVIYQDEAYQLIWNDGSQEFFCHLESGGSVPFRSHVRILN